MLVAMWVVQVVLQGCSRLKYLNFAGMNVCIEIHDLQRRSLEDFGDAKNVSLALTQFILGVSTGIKHQNISNIVASWVLNTNLSTVYKQIQVCPTDVFFK